MSNEQWAMRMRMRMKKKKESKIKICIRRLYLSVRTMYGPENSSAIHPTSDFYQNNRFLFSIQYYGCFSILDEIKQITNSYKRIFAFASKEENESMVGSARKGEKKNLHSCFNYDAICFFFTSLFSFPCHSHSHSIPLTQLMTVTSM